MEALKTEKINQILEALVGATVSIKYVSAASEETEVGGILEAVDKDIIRIREPLIDSVFWINRHGITLTSVRLLQAKREEKESSLL